MACLLVFPSQNAFPEFLNVLVCSSCHNKNHRLGGINNRNLLSHSSGGWKSKIKVPARLVSGGASLPGLPVAAFSPCLHMASPLCSCGEEGDISGVSSSSYKDTSPIGLGPHPNDLI